MSACSVVQIQYGSILVCYQSDPESAQITGEGSSFVLQTPNSDTNVAIQTKIRQLNRSCSIFCKDNSATGSKRPDLLKSSLCSEQFIRSSVQFSHCHASVISCYFSFVEQQRHRSVLNPTVE